VDAAGVTPVGSSCQPLSPSPLSVPLDAVGNGQLSADAVTTDKIADGTIARLHHFTGALESVGAPRLRLTERRPAWCRTRACIVRQRRLCQRLRVSSTFDQQPIRRTVGRRIPRDGRPMTDADREAMTRNARYTTRAPKGVFIYYSAEEMEAGRLRWTVDAVLARQEP